MPAAPRPFDDTAFAIQGLTIESAADRIALHGSLDLTRDRAGLAQARQLAAYLHATVAALEADPALPATVGTEAPIEQANPFA
jgi:hypothetical protein